MPETVAKYLSQHWDQGLIVLFLAVRLFPELRDYAPDIFAVMFRGKKISSIKVKSDYDLKYFTRKHIFIADEVLPVTDCKSFFARLMFQMDQLKTKPEPVVFNLVKVERITEAAFKGLRQFVDTLAVNDNLSIQIIFPRHSKAKGHMVDLMNFALDRTKKSQLIEAWEDRRKDNDDSQE